MVLFQAASWLIACQIGLAGPLDFTPASPLNINRLDFSATKLIDGRILVAGGQVPIFLNGSVIGWQPLNSAEIYDPTSGTWTNTGSMNTVRASHSGTLLNDGRVLVVGGDDLGGTAEFYNPATGLWVSAPTMPSNRSSHAAVLLQDGRVLIVGGYYNLSNVTADTPLYSPGTNTWKIPGPMKKARVGMTLDLLANGQALATGGLAPNDSGQSLQATAELFDPATDTWSFTGSLAIAREYHFSASLNDGTVLVGGGYAFDGHGSQIRLRSAENYDPSTSSWTQIADMRGESARALSQVLTDGSVLVVNLPQTEIFNPDSKSWNSISLPDFPHGGGAIVPLSDGRTLLVGGNGADGMLSAYSEIFNESSRLFSVSVFIQDASESLVVGQGNSGASYIVQSSENLTDGFVDLSGVIVASANGLFTFDDFRPVAPKRFYRAISVDAAHASGVRKTATRAPLSRIAK